MPDDSTVGALLGQVQGEEGAELRELSGNTLSLLHGSAFPPGKPLSLVVALEPPLELTGRTVGSKRQPDGRFLVRVRLTNLRKEHREALATRLSPG